MVCPIPYGDHNYIPNLIQYLNVCTSKSTIQQMESHIHQM